MAFERGQVATVQGDAQRLDGQHANRRQVGGSAAVEVQQPQVRGDGERGEIDRADGVVDVDGLAGAAVPGRGQVHRQVVAVLARAEGQPGRVPSAAPVSVGGAGVEDDRVPGQVPAVPGWFTLVGVGGDHVLQCHPGVAPE